LTARGNKPMPVGDPNAFVFCDPTLIAYETPTPFHPGEPYPEYRHENAGTCGSNRVYAAVREYLRLFGGDREHFGQPEWNPLGHLIRPGETALVKPNWVKHLHDLGLALDIVITHPSVLRPILDYLVIALQGKGRIIVGDAPIQSCDFEVLCERTGILQLIEHYANCTSVVVELADFRKERALVSLHAVVDRLAIPGDPNGYAAVQFGSRSMLQPVDERAPRFRVTNYDPHQMAGHHRRDHHEYLIAGSVLKADLVLFVPKMKTHRKAGITAALKNSVGVNGSKDWLPHHSQGSTRDGGDEYLHRSMLKRASDALEEWVEAVKGRGLKRILGLARSVLHQSARIFARDKYFEGSWYGNDTVWRMVLDLNRALLYADREGTLQETPQRRTYFLVDGIVAGDREGPISPSPKTCGLLVGGESAPVVDAVIASLMGFDYRKIPLVREAFTFPDLPLVDFGAEDVRVHSNVSEFEGMALLHPPRHFGFVPTSGWQGHIELGQVDPAIYSRFVTDREREAATARTY
jgi:uncharacterized protein (DUF362 family)